MLQLITENKERIIIPTLTTVGLYLLAKAEVSDKFNYLVPTASEFLLMLALVIIYQQKEKSIKKQQQETTNEESGHLKKSLDELVEQRERLKSCNASIVDKLDKRIDETLDRIHEAGAEEYKKIKEKQEILKRSEEIIRSEKQYYQKGAYKAFNAISGGINKQLNATEEYKKGN